MVRRRFGMALASGLLTLSLLLSACASTPAPIQAPAATAPAEPKKVTLLVWDHSTGGARAKATEELYKMFQAKYPHITIQREAMPLSQMQTTLKTAIGAGTGPDVFHYDVGGHARIFADAGLAMDLTPYAQKHGWFQRIHKWANDLSVFNGKLYALPLEGELVGLFYNKDIFAKEGFKVPGTFEETLAYCQAAKAKGYIPFAFSMNPGWQAYHPFAGFLGNLIGRDELGKFLLDPKANWERPEVVQSIKLFFVDMNKAGCFPPGVNAITGADGMNFFYQGKAAATVTGSWNGAAMAQNMPNVNVGLVPFPQLKPGGPAMYAGGIGGGYLMSGKTKNPDEAALFLDFLFSHEAAKVWVENGTVPPMDYNFTGWTMAPMVKVSAEIVQTMNKPGSATQIGHYIDLFGPEAFMTLMRQGFQGIFAGTITPEKLASDLRKAWAEGHQ